MDYGLLMDPGINTAVQNFSVPLTSFFVSWLFLDTMHLGHNARAAPALRGPAHNAFRD
jgi:hypothetical protein